MTKWYVVLTKPKQEERAEEHLQAQGGEVFLPRIALEKVRKGKRVEVIEPLFPGYLFVNVAGCEQLVASIRSTRGVRQLLKFGIEPLEVDDGLITDLRSRCYKQIEKQIENQNENSLERKGVFKQGQKVEVTSGPFKDYQAIFKQFDGETRAIILLNLLNQQQELLVELEQLQTSA
jgi:transcriptional antiterminator RfaH